MNENDSGKCGRRVGRRTEGNAKSRASRTSIMFRNSDTSFATPESAYYAYSCPGKCRAKRRYHGSARVPVAIAPRHASAGSSRPTMARPTLLRHHEKLYRHRLNAVPSLPIHVVMPRFGIHAALTLICTWKYAVCELYSCSLCADHIIATHIANSAFFGSPPRD